MSKRPVASLTMSRKVNDAWQNYSVLSIWETDHAGLFSVSADKGSEKYPSIGLIDAIKGFASGARFSIRVSRESGGGQRGGGSQGGGDRRGNDDFGGGGSDFGDNDIPFRQRAKRGPF